MKDLIVIIFLTVLLLFGLEFLTRIYISLNYGDANAGLEERSVNLSYRPFVMWGPDFDKQSEEFADQKDINDEEFIILVVGGSTAEQFSENTRGLGTLEEAFKKLFDSSERTLRIFNSAVGAFNIRQEVAALLITVDKIKPDLILVIDGANDIQHSMRSGVTPGTTFVDSTYEAFLKKPYLGPFFYAAQNSQFVNGLYRYFNRYEIINNNQTLEPNMMKTLDYYYEGRDFINNYAKGAGIEIVFMLQPHVAFSNSEDDREARQRYIYRSPAVKKVFTSVSESHKSLELCFVDSNHDLNDQNLSLEFIDDVHFKNRKGYSYMADLLYETYLSCYIK